MIVNCFQKRGFVKPLPEDSSYGKAEVDTLSLPEVINGAEYLDIDNDAPCFP